jgi:hypothetical protein
MCNGFPQDDLGIQFAYGMSIPVMYMKCGLLGCLQQFRRFSATDPRDKVYGFMALNETSHEKHQIKIDYPQSTAKLYADVATAIIRKSGHLEVLEAVHHPAGYDGDPEFVSWAPRWDQHLGQLPVRCCPIEQPDECKHIPFGRKDFSIIPGEQLAVNGLVLRTTSRVEWRLSRDYAAYDFDVMNQLEAECRSLVVDFWSTVDKHPEGSFERH